jgi:hypothetical protein
MVVAPAPVCIRPPGVCLSFDDRMISEWHGMRMLLKKYDARVTFFVTKFDSLSANEKSLLVELEDDCHEIGSHGALHVLAESYIKSFGYRQYLEQEVDASLRVMREEGFDPTAFAYPYGSKFWFTDQLILQRFKIVRGVAAVNPQIELSKMDDAYHTFDGGASINAVSIDCNSGLTEEALLMALDRAFRDRSVLMLYGHYAVNNCKLSTDQYSFDIDFLEFILSETVKRELVYYRMQDLD